MILHKLHWAVFACGAALLAVAAVGAARGWSSTGLWVLLIAGGACLLMALIAHRLVGVTVEHGDTKIGFTLDAKVSEDLKVTGLSGAASIYSFVHNQLGKDPDLAEVKVRLQDQIVKMVQDNAFSEPVGSVKVDQVLSSGSPAERVLIFGLLQSDHTLATVERLREGISESRSGNEQYHALLATWKNWGNLSESDRQKLSELVRTAPYITEDSDRKELAAKILTPQPSHTPNAAGS
jgi:hypothetical protein